MKSIRCVVPSVLMAAAGAALAQPAINGTVDLRYYDRQWTNATPTQFGNNNYTPPGPCPPTSGAE